MINLLLYCVVCFVCVFCLFVLCFYVCVYVVLFCFFVCVGASSVCAARISYKETHVCRVSRKWFTFTFYVGSLQIV